MAGETMLDSEHNMTLLDIEQMEEKISRKASQADFVMSFEVDEEEDSFSPN